MFKRKFVIPVIIAVLIFSLYFPIRYVIAQNNDLVPEQPDNAESSEIIAVPKNQESLHNLAPNEFTPENYIPPVYDPFFGKYESDGKIPDPIDPKTDITDIPPKGEFRVYTDKKGVAQRNSGTVDTQFTFKANVSDKETYTSKLKVRWDFEGDGELDSYFSRTKGINHIYDEPGIYTVTMEILDTGGNISKYSREVNVVENTPPTAFFTYKPDSGTPGTIFKFNVNGSYDSQYSDSYLEYRFDWDDDGIFDTKYNRKTTWRHRFGKSGVYKVVLEVRDPEGLTSAAYRTIEVKSNNPPRASFEIEVKERKSYDGTVTKTYYFDASASSDEETPGNYLKYRWDFNYTGPNDINFNVKWTNSSKHSGNYKIPGEKVIRLQVKDKDGAISEVFQTIIVD